MAIGRQKQQVFNKPVGVVRAQPKTATAETWQSISEASQSLSAMVYKQASAEAEMAGIKKSMEVDVLDESGNISKAPVNMGSIGTKSFEKNMMARYENKMRLMIDNKVTQSLANNPNDSDDFNTSASIAVGALIDNADPTFQGILKDYASAKISAGNNTVLRNRNQIDSQERVAETITMTDQMANQAVNAYLSGNNRLAEDLEARIERAWTDLRSNRDATAGQSQDRINAYRRNILTARIGMSLREMSSSEIQSAIDAFNKGTLKDIVDTDRMQKAGVSYEGIKNLITLHPHIADDLVIGRTMSNVEQDQSKVEADQALNNDLINFQQKLDAGYKIDIGKKEMGAYTQYVLNTSGIEMKEYLTASDLLQLSNSPNFYKIVEQQMKLPDMIKDKFKRLANGSLSTTLIDLPNGGQTSEAFAMIEMYQQMTNNVSPRGINRNLGGAFGLDSDLITKIKGINNLITFNSTPEGVAKAMELASMDANDMLSSAVNAINNESWGFFATQPENVNNASSAKTFMRKLLAEKLGDMTLASEVVDETLLLSGMIGAKDALEMMVETVKEQWVQSEYTVDYTSGGNALQTRYAPEVIFGNDTNVLKDFEADVLALSGVKDGVLGENVFVLVDPNSAETNVRYYIVTRQADGSTMPVIDDDKLVSIELIEYADQISEENKQRLKDNLDFGKKFRERIHKSWDKAEKKLYYGQYGDVIGTF